MYGKDINELHVVVGYQLKVQLKGNQGPHWKQMFVDLPVGKEFQVCTKTYFESVKQL